MSSTTSNAVSNVHQDGHVAAKRHSKFSTVIRVTSGNFIEMYDFFLFGFYATYIAKAFSCQQ
jgi:MHS family citrate/tricarballylate:H+ symporter-like MFS transporter